MNREEFQQKLADLGEEAAKKRNRLTGEQVRNFFNSMELSEEQYELIFSYLASCQIVVEGYVPAEREEEKEKKKEK